MSDQLDITRQVTVARRQRGLTQSELAREVGCRQSAISMFERGHANALARPKIEALLKRLELEMPSGSDDASAGPETLTQSDGAIRHLYCPVFDCPSNVPFTVQDTLLIKPQVQPAANAKHCAFCGELLENACPECGAPASGGACCTQCGTPYISTPPRLTDENPSAWADAQRARLRELGIS